MAIGKSLQSADYVVLFLGIFASLATGIIFALKGRHHLSSYHFHRGGGRLTALPVAMSMLLTFESSIFYVGYPAEVYLHGAIYWLTTIGFTIGYSSMLWISIPLFYPLQVTSVYEYLQMRHGSLLIRQVGMAMSVLYMTLYAGIVLFGAAVALQSVIGLSVWIYIILMSVIAVIYTCLGGIKAVVLTDVVQGIIMIGMIFAVLIYGIMRVGGVQSVIDFNKPAGRLNFVDFDPNPLTRHTVWTLVFGTAIRDFGFSCKPQVIQRLNSTKSIREAKKVAIMSIIGFIILELLIIFEGIVAYAYFVKKGCDPLAAGQITNPNQIIPYLVIDMFEDFPGMTGLFLAALCSASLSTISSLLSSVSAIVSEDVIRSKLKSLSDTALTQASRVVVVVCGCICIGVGIMISQVQGPMSQISGSILGALDGPFITVFFLSIFIKCTTRKGIIVSIVVGVSIALWLSWGYSFSTSRKKTPWLPLGPIDKCYNQTMTFSNGSASNASHLITPMYMNNETVHDIPEQSGITHLHGIDYLYSISYQYFATMVTLVTLMCGIVTSMLTSKGKLRDIPTHLMLRLNKKLFLCQPNHIELAEHTNDPSIVLKTDAF